MRKRRKTAARRRPVHGIHREPVQRAKAIHDLIIAGKYPNAYSLAEQLEVSVKTVRRDIEGMRKELPIEFDSVRNGFYYSRPVTHFPGADTVRPEEVAAVIIAQKAADQIKDTPFGKTLHDLVARFLNELDPDGRISIQGLQHSLSFLDAGQEPTPSHEMSIIIQALRENRAVTYDYRKPCQAPESRRLYPYHLFYKKGRWYVAGHDPAKKGIRKFAVSRMANVSLSIQHFKPDPKFTISDYLKNSFGVMSGDLNWEVVVDFDAWSTDLMRGRKWHPSQKVTELPNGCSRVRFLLGELEEISEWVMGWGMHATVVRPAALRERLRKTGEEYARRYSDYPGDASPAHGWGMQPELDALTRSLPPLELWKRN